MKIIVNDADMKANSLPRRTFIGCATSGMTALAGAAFAEAEKTPPASIADLAAAKPADLLLALVEQLDGQRLDDEHLAQLRLDMEANLRRSALLSQFPLTNADEPAPVFHAWRAEG